MIRRAFVLLALASLALPAAADAAPSKVLARFDGTLSGPASGAPADVALDYVHAHRAELGLDAADLDSLGTPEVTTAGTFTQIRWPQEVDGIPAADSELKVNLASDGRVLNVLGEPAHDLDANTTPLVDAGEAVRAVQDAVGVFRPVPRDKGPVGVTQATTYVDGTSAELALDDRRLVWRVTYRASSTAVYDAFVDARSGGVRRRVNMVKSDTNALVWENYPQAPNGGTATTENLEQNNWLAAGAPRLSGPNVHAYSDLDDDDFADAGEEFAAPYSIALNTGFAPASSGCAPASKPCTWNQNAASSWTTNRKQNAVQAFYFANRFHDHLAATPIGFSPSEGSFDSGSDPLELQTDDGAATLLPAKTLPDGDHRNNANMFTPPDGNAPVMQMYLWAGGGYRTMNGGDDASILYHEYTHGLSNRLVTDAGGRGALNSPQAGAMGEGWSDWYAKDWLVTQYAGLDNTGVNGDVDMGAYTDATLHSIRTQGLDCPVGASAGVCPGAGSAGSGGYTYGDFGKIATRPEVYQEVHSDGEIWAETLWDLRRAVGSAAALRLVTDGMRLSPPEPTFLDMRNAILLADQAAGGGLRSTIWGVFAARGMGYYASTSEATSVPVEDFQQPPLPGDPRGRIAGTVRDSSTAEPIAGATVVIAGLGDGPDRLTATSGADGTFAIENVPVRTFPSVVTAAPGFDKAVSAVTVTAGTTAPMNPALARNWAAAAGGAVITPGPGSDEYASQGCGPDAAVDQKQGTGWSTKVAAGGKSMVVTLPRAVDISDFAVDPAEACGDDSDSATRDYRIETSTETVDGPWTESAAGGFGNEARHALTPVSPTAATAGVRHVRLSILSTQGGGDFLDLSEFTVHGRAVAAPVQTPVPTPSAQPTPIPTPIPTPVPTPPALAPPSFSLPAKGKTTVVFKVTCAAECKITAQLTVDRPTAKRLGLGKVLTAGTLTATVKEGKKTLTLKLKSKARKAFLKGPRKRTYRARLKVTGAYAATAPVSRSRQVTLMR